MERLTVIGPVRGVHRLVSRGVDAPDRSVVNLRYVLYLSTVKLYTKVPWIGYLRSLRYFNPPMFGPQNTDIHSKTFVFLGIHVSFKNLHFSMSESQAQFYGRKWLVPLQ